MVKNPPAMQEIQVQSLGWEPSLRRKWLPPSVCLPGEFHEQRRMAGYSPWGRQESDMTERLPQRQHNILSLSAQPETPWLDTEGVSHHVFV